MSRFRKDGGFTLIELLVVMLIVAILAAVAIPVFFRQKEKAHQDQIVSALKNAGTAMESYATEHQGDYSGLDGGTGADLLDQGWNEDSHAYLVYLRIHATNTSWCLEAEHGDAAAASDWRQATLTSGGGTPQALPDLCP